MSKKSGVTLNWGGFNRAIEKSISRMANKKPLLKDCAEVLVSGTLKRFIDERDPEGKPWAPVPRRGKILSDTAALQKSIDSAVTEDSVMVGTNKEYAITHQEGATIKPKKGKYLKFKTPDGGFVSVKEVTIKKRSFIGVSQDDLKNLRETMADHLMRAFKG